MRHPQFDRSKRLVASFACSVALMTTMTAVVQAQTMRTHHLRADVASGQAPFVGELPADQTMNLNIALPLRNEADLDTLLQQLYDPQSPQFHKFLSVQEFTDRFGPTQDDYDQVIQFAQRNGLLVTGTYPNRLVVNVSGPVKDIEKAFRVTMASYQHPTEARTFYSPDREPSADLAIPLWHVSGLDNYSIPHPMSLVREAGENAKPQRRLLPAPDQADISSAATCAPPITETVI